MNQQNEDRCVRVIETDDSHDMSSLISVSDDRDESTPDLRRLVDEAIAMGEANPTYVHPNRFPFDAAG